MWQHFVSGLQGLIGLPFCSYIQQLRDGVHNFFATFIEVLRDRPPGHDWELEPGVTCGDYLFGMLQVKLLKLNFTMLVAFFMTLIFWSTSLSSVDNVLFSLN